MRPGAAMVESAKGLTVGGATSRADLETALCTKWGGPPSN